MVKKIARIKLVAVQDDFGKVQGQDLARIISPTMAAKRDALLIIRSPAFKAALFREENLSSFSPMTST